MTESAEQSSLPKPKVIFFDAVGTLFGIRGSVGEIYSHIAGKYGVDASADALNSSFGRVFSRTPSLAFGQIPASDIPSHEYQWWYEVAQETFSEVELLRKFADFEIFFQDLYVYFATKKPWYLYQDTIDCLEKWQAKSVELGIISNFDTRIYQVLKLLKISHYFNSVTVSSEAGFAKPNPKIFKTALAKHSCSPSQAWHVGDSSNDDFQGSSSVGIRAFLLARDKIDSIVENQLPNLNSLG